MRIKVMLVRTAAGLGLIAGLLLSARSALTLDSAGEGRRVYLKQNCYGCHGGRGGGGMGPNFRGAAPDQATVAAALQGLPGGMPAYPGLTATDIQNLTAYLQSLRTSAEPTFTRWWQAVPTQ